MSLITHNSHTVFIGIHSLFLTFFFPYQRAAINKAPFQSYAFEKARVQRHKPWLVHCLRSSVQCFSTVQEKPGVCPSNGFTPASPVGHHSTERCSETAGGIRIKGHFFTAAMEVFALVWWRSGTAEGVAVKGGWQEFLGITLIWRGTLTGQDPPACHQELCNVLCQGTRQNIRIHPGLGTDPWF